MSQPLLTVLVLALSLPVVTVRFHLPSASGLGPPQPTAASVPPEGGKGVTFPFSAKAPVVVCLNGYDTARDRLTRMLKAALPKDADTITDRIRAELGRVFEGRMLTAVRRDARLYLVVNDLEELFEDEPAVSVLIPVTNYKDFRDSFLTAGEKKSLEQGMNGVDAIRTTALGDETVAYLVDLKDYVAITTDKATAEGYAGNYTAANSEDLGSELAETFLRADLAVYVNMDAINDRYGDQIRALRGLIEFAVQQANQQGALSVLSQKQVEVLRELLKVILQGVEDCRGIVAAAEFQPGGLYMKAQLRFAGDSVTAKLVASESADPLADLGKLPAGLGNYQALKWSGKLGQLMRGLDQEVITTEDDVRGAQLIEQHRKDLAAADPGAEFTATRPPGVNFSVTAYKDPEKAQRALTKTLKAVAPGGRVNGIVVKTTPRVGDEAESHRGFTFSSVNLNYDFAATVAGVPEEIREATLEQLKGSTPEKAVLWIGTDKRVVVQIQAKDWEAARSLLDKYLDGKLNLAAAAGYKLVREQLPREANYLLVAEIETLLSNVVSNLKMLGDTIPGFPAIGPLKKLNRPEAHFLGFAITFKVDTITLTGYLPAQTIAAGREVLENLFKKIE